MIAHVKGKVEQKGMDYAIIDVNGVGYLTYMSGKNLAKININEDVKVLTYMHIREDIMHLYGFLEELEVELFKVLLGVTGVGPKVALAVLSHCTTDEIIIGINDERPEIFTKVSGIGKKTAQRIILDSKDKIKNFPIVSKEIIQGQDISENIQTNNVIEETIEALISLGYSLREIKDVVYNTAKQAEKSLSVEELLNLVLRQLASLGR